MWDTKGAPPHGGLFVYPVLTSDGPWTIMDEYLTPEGLIAAGNDAVRKAIF